MDVIDSGTYAQPILAALTVKLSQPDVTSPVTSITLDGNLGSNNWYTSDVQVTISSTDNQDGSGIAKTEYSFDGSKWTIYTGPFSITKEGQTILFYRSVDKASNSEIIKNLTINIDKTVPTTTATFTVPSGGNDWTNTGGQVTLNVEDNAGGSGGAETEYSLDGITWLLVLWTRPGIKSNQKPLSSK